MVAMRKFSPAVGLIALINEALELGAWSFFCRDRSYTYLKYYLLISSTAK